MKTKKSTIFWTILKYNEWSIHIAASSKGLIFVGSQNQTLDELTNWLKKRIPNYELVKNDEKLLQYKNEIIWYLQGRLKKFSIPFDYYGTPFQITVWNALQEIPYGETRTYTDLANQINKPSSVRAVGTAIGANPILISIPCHRVIGKNGSLTGYRGGLDMKKQLLKLEQAKILIPLSY